MMVDTENKEQILNFEPKEGIKLIRNASQIYQWEIKVHSLDATELLKIDDGIRSELDRRGLKYIKEGKNEQR